MKLLKRNFDDLKKRLYEGDEDAICYITCILYNALRLVIGFLLPILAFIYYLSGWAFVGLMMIFFSIVWNIYRPFSQQLMTFCLTIIIKLYSKYGPVISKEDWKRIKKADKKLYRNANCDASLGKCYDYSRNLAMYLKDACLLYCSVTHNQYKRTAHAVILKNGFVYDTNLRMHVKLQTYEEQLDMQVYKVFTEDEYRDEEFFFNIKDDFVSWCEKNGVHHLFS